MKANPTRYFTPFWISIGAFVLYFFTAARDPQFGDGLEFVAAAAARGIPHPTGYPLFTLLITPFAHSPKAYFYSTIICSFFAAATAGFVCLLAHRILNLIVPRQNIPVLKKWLPVFWGVTLAVSASLWSSATHVEVYGINAFFIAVVLVLLIPAGDTPTPTKRLVIAAFLTGLAATNHLTALSLCPMLAASAVTQARMRKSRLGVTIAAMVAAGCVGLLVYLYLPIAAARRPAINWGNPVTPQSFLWLISGGSYREWYFMQSPPGFPFSIEQWMEFAGGRTISLISALGGELTSGFNKFPRGLFLFNLVLGVGLLVPIFMGIGILWKSNPIIALGLLAGIAMQLLIVYTYSIADIADYFLGVWMVVLPFFIIGLRSALISICRRLNYPENDQYTKRLLFPLAAIIALSFMSNWGLANRARNNLASVYIQRLADAVPSNSILITHGDYDTYSFWYAQQVLDQDREVLNVAAHFMRMHWYEAMLPSADDPASAIVTMPESGSFLNYTAADHASMIAENIIDPNLDKTSIVMTVPEPQLLQLLNERYAIKPIAKLLTDEEAEWMMENYAGAASQYLVQVKTSAQE